MKEVPTIKAESVAGFTIVGNKWTIIFADDAGRSIAHVEMTFDARGVD
jgi:hypothetical protein